MLLVPIRYMFFFYFLFRYFLPQCTSVRRWWEAMRTRSCVFRGYYSRHSGQFRNVKSCPGISGANRDLFVRACTNSARGTSRTHANLHTVGRHEAQKCENSGAQSRDLRACDRVVTEIYFRDVNSIVPHRRFTRSLYKHSLVLHRL